MDIKSGARCSADPEVDEAVSVPFAAVRTLEKISESCETIFDASHSEANECTEGIMWFARSVRSWKSHWRHPWLLLCWRTEGAPLSVSNRTATRRSQTCERNAHSRCMPIECKRSLIHRGAKVERKGIRCIEIREAQTSL